MYIGAPAFGARQAAGNSMEDLAEVVRYAHTYGVQVLVTLNTLLHEDEYPRAVALAHALYKIGVDALIIQDLHLLDFDLPPIRLHASTQCDNRTPEQVARLRDLGFRRVVLARELSIEEIRAIHAAVPDIELEAFVHGALCVSYSGRCYISEVLAGRSANRGACAQYCRMAYDLLDESMNEVLDNDGKPIHQRYVLSLQDMDRSVYLQELIDAGVTTFKIEGRLKDSDYVTNVTACYRDLLDHLTNSHTHIYSRTFVPDPEKTFHRGGIDYFLHGRTPKTANWETPKSTGEYIGETERVQGNRVWVHLKEGIVLHNGDGLTIGGEGFNVNGINGNIILANKVLSPADGNRLPLYRNYDIEFAKSLHSERKIPVTILFRETEDGFELQIGDKKEHLVYSHEPAKNADRAIDTIRTQLSKLGDTPYVAQEVHIESRPYFIPVSILNEWRRTALGIQNTEYRSQTDSQIRSVSPKDGLYSVSPKDGLYSVSPKDGLYSVSPKDGLYSVSPKDGLYSVSPKDGLYSVSPKDGLYSVSPKDGLYSVSETVCTLSATRSLMECKYCILHEAGHCRKKNPFPKDKEPRYLRLRTGQTLRLTFDCKRCEMLVDSICK